MVQQNFLTQFRVMMYKNLLLKRAMWMMTSLEVLYPLLILFSLSRFPHSNDQSLIDNGYEESIGSLQQSCYYTWSGCKLYYAPEKPEYAAFIRDHIVKDSGIEVFAFPTFDILKQFYLDGDEYESNRYFISFDDSNKDSRVLSYRLHSGDSYYMYNAKEIQKSVFVTAVNSTDRYVTLKTHYLPHVYSFFGNLYGAIYQNFFFFIELLTIISLVTNVTKERQTKMKEYLKMAGLKTSVYWLSWVATQSIILIINLSLFVIISAIFNILPKVNYFLLFVFVFFFSSCTTMLALLISVFCQNFKTAVALASGALAFFSGFQNFLFFVVDNSYPNFSKFFYWIPMVPFGEIMARLGTSTEYCNFSGMGLQVLWLFLDNIIYFVLVWYFFSVIPTEFGVPKSPLFFISPSYWGFGQRKKSEEERSLLLDEKFRAPAEATPEPKVEMGIVTRDLKKTYSKGRCCKGEETTAVDNVCLNIPPGAVLACVGPNGAGKTTLLSILTGLFPPTAGTASIQGFSLTSDADLEMIQENLGVCPQHDVLFEDLSLEQNLRIFGMLRGIETDVIARSSIEICQCLGISEHYPKKAKTLSGGTKRKLSIALAFIGDPSIIMLDECTSGLDPRSRQIIGEFIMKKKMNKIILLTTHFMEEADILGDYVAVLDHGKLVCCEPPSELKRKYGYGYHLTLVRDSSVPDQMAKEWEHNVVAFVQKIYSSAVFKSSSNKEVSLILPHSYTDMGNLGTLFFELDRALQSLFVSSYGITSSSLEECYLAIVDEFEGNTEAYPIGRTPN
eukprot:TRINITY_DN23141_c0_g1_i1.p1 TRINITY_DN23141_c0_g1~~TRINITY_DN23141_c0_g1_i1.p1  ORF type:complete len:786 (+),score=179.91 TRINITY_DN23141_c0_g1_i1:1-2358(+)